MFSAQMQPQNIGGTAKPADLSFQKSIQGQQGHHLRITKLFSKIELLIQHQLDGIWLTYWKHGCISHFGGEVQNISCLKHDCMMLQANNIKPLLCVDGCTLSRIEQKQELQTYTQLLLHRKFPNQPYLLWQHILAYMYICCMYHMYI